MIKSPTRALLTSSGVSTPLLRSTFLTLLGRDPKTCRLVFIPTATNVLSDVSWMEQDLADLRSTGIGTIDWVDLATLPAQEVLARCHNAQVIWLHGGNTYFLLDWVRRSTLDVALPELLLTRLYVGVSAGSMIVGPTIESNSPMFPEEDGHKITNVTGLHLVPFAVIPHLNAPHFPHCTQARIEAFARRVSYPVYGLDDSSAIEVRSERIKIISSGKVCSYNTSP